MGTLSRAEVYEKYADDLIRFATGLVGPSDASDVVAAAVVRALWAPAWSSVKNQRSYLYKAVLNEVRMRHRATMRRRVRELRALDHPPVHYSPEIRPDVLEAVGRLTPRQRAVVFLVYWEDQTPAQVARHLGLSEGTTHRHLRRAESRLRRMLYE